MGADRNPLRRPAAAAFAVAGLAALWWVLSPAGSALDVVTTRPADAFVDSVGVNTHVTYADTSYARHAEIAARLRELGVRHVRDGLFPERADEVARLHALAVQGQRATLILRPPAARAARIVDGRLRGAVEAVENPNELDNRGVADWPAVARSFAPRLRAAVHGVPVLGPSLAFESNRARIASAAAQWDITNVHRYAAGQPPERGLAADLRRAREAEGGRRPLVVTESGHHDALRATAGQPPVSDDAAGVYVPRLLLEDFRLGVARTFLYELADERPEPGLRDPEQHFGLLREDLSAKPAFTALRALLATLRAPRGDGRLPPAAAPQLRTDATARDVRVVGLDRDDGARVIALWRPVPVWSTAARRAVLPAATTVRVTFDRTPKAVALVRPSAGGAARALPRERALSVPVGADVALLVVR